MQTLDNKPDIVSISAFKYLIRVLAGFLCGVIFNAIVGYKYPPILYNYLLALLTAELRTPSSLGAICLSALYSSAAHISAITLLAIFTFSSLSRISKNVALMLYGFWLSLLTAVSASAVSGGIYDIKHPVICSVIILFFSAVSSVILILFCSESNEITTKFDQNRKKHDQKATLFTFFSLSVTFISFLGAIIICESVKLLLLNLLN